MQKNSVQAEFFELNSVIMKRKFSHNPFAALEGLRDKLPVGQKTVESDSEKTVNIEEREGKSVLNKVVVHEKAHDVEAEKRDAAAREEDEALLKEVWEIFDSLGMLDPREKSNSKRYYGIRDAIIKSREFDTSYDIRRWFEGWTRLAEETGRSEVSRLKEISEMLLRRAAESGAVKCVLSATPEGMKYGSAPRDQRIAEAREYAKRAGSTLEDVMQKRGISLKL